MSQEPNVPRGTKPTKSQEEALGPGFSKLSQYADILAKDSVGNPFTYEFYFGNTGLIDIYNPKGKHWFKAIYKHGVAYIYHTKQYKEIFEYFQLKISI